MRLGDFFRAIGSGRAIPVDHPAREVMGIGIIGSHDRLTMSRTELHYNS
jgi:hypothetical protein